MQENKKIITNKVGRRDKDERSGRMMRRQSLQYRGDWIALGTSTTNTDSSRQRPHWWGHQQICKGLGRNQGFFSWAFGWDVLLNEWTQSFNVEILNGMWNTVSSFDAHSSTPVFSSQRVQDKRSKNQKGLVLENTIHENNVRVFKRFKNKKSQLTVQDTVSNTDWI